MKMPSTSDEGSLPQYASRLTLKNGREVFLRPILQTDGPLLVDLFNKLSSQSIYLRFLSPLHALPEDLIHHFTHIDYHNDFALVAVIEEDGKDAIIAVGRYAYDPQDHYTDLAIAVRDDWQHVGLGKSLLAKTVAIGKEHGITRFVSVISPENHIIRQVLRNLGYEVKYSKDRGVDHVEILV